MKRSFIKLFLPVLTLLVLIASATSLPPVRAANNAQVVLLENFDAATLPTSLGLGAQHGGTIELVQDPSKTYGGTGKSLKATYPAQPIGAAGDVFAWGGVDLTSYNTDNVYIRFYAKMPGVKRGLKFVKVFGQKNGSQYANSTFGLDYTGVDVGGMYATSFGDGSTPENDTQNAFILDGSDPSWAGRSYGLPGFSVKTPQGKTWASSDWGTDWHLFEFAVKFNSGTSAATETNDGAYLVRIDGKVYLEARGIYNRHYSNLPLDSIQILGWTQLADGGAAPSFEIWYDDIQVKVNDWDFLKSPTTQTFNSITAQDGRLLESAENSDVGGTINNSASIISLGDDTANRQYRGIVSFSTASIPDNAIISGVTLKLKQQAIVGGGNPLSIFQGLMLDVKNGFFGTFAALQPADFQGLATATYGPANPAPVSGVYSVNLTAAKANINKLTTNGGLTQIRLRFKLDDNNDGIANYLNLYSGDAPNATDRPQLVITYTLP